MLANSQGILGKVRTLHLPMNNLTDSGATLISNILDHPENSDPYAHPIYPQDAIKDNDFWVLTGDDLRGIHISSEDFSNTLEFEGKSLSYSMLNV